MVEKKITQFYDLRSQFVHGRMEIPHPSANEILDQSVYKIHDDLLDMSDFAFSLILATIQEHVRNNWREVKFTETFNGINIQ